MSRSRITRRKAEHVCLSVALSTFTIVRAIKTNSRGRNNDPRRSADTRNSAVFPRGKCPGKLHRDESKPTVLSGFIWENRPYRDGYFATFYLEDKFSHFHSPIFSLFLFFSFFEDLNHSTLVVLTLNLAIFLIIRRF